MGSIDAAESPGAEVELEGAHLDRETLGSDRRLGCRRDPLFLKSFRARQLESSGEESTVTIDASSHVRDGAPLHDWNTWAMLGDS